MVKRKRPEPTPQREPDELFPDSSPGLVFDDAPSLFPDSGRAASNDGLTFDDDSPGLMFEDSPSTLFPEEEVPIDPIGEIDYPGTADGDTKATLTAVQSALQKGAKEQAERMKNLDDSEFWFGVMTAAGERVFVFETREQKETFLTALGWIKLGDKYIDGVELARLMKVKLPPSSLKPLHPKPDPKLSDLSHPIE